MGERLAGKIAIITGAASGIGLVIARTFVTHGASVVIADVNPAGQGVAEAIRRDGGDAAFVRADVADPGDVGRVVAAAEAFGRLNVVVNNAAWTREANVVALTEEVWDRTVDVCLKSAYLVAKAAIPVMQHGGGSIVNISSVNGIVTNPGFAAYSAAKAGLLGLTRNLALEYGFARVRVNAICPGIIATDAFHELIQGDPPEREAARRVQPLPDWGTPEDVALAAVYLASDESRFMTGATLVLDGGLTIQSPEGILRPTFRRRWPPGHPLRLDPS
jgi:NAD(P)-dependent dehydrogenase (short-subunit alcohol dehydrogenase family)